MITPPGNGPTTSIDNNTENTYTAMMSETDNSKAWLEAAAPIRDSELVSSARE